MASASTDPVIIEFSSELFGGYNVTIIPEQYHNLETLISYCRDRLWDSLNQLNLRELANKVRDANFHVHDFEIFNLCERTRLVYYICHHEHKNHIDNNEAPMPVLSSSLTNETVKKYLILCSTNLDYNRAREILEDCPYFNISMNNYDGTYDFIVECTDSYANFLKIQGVDVKSDHAISLENCQINI